MSLNLKDLLRLPPAQPAVRRTATAPTQPAVSQGATQKSGGGGAAPAAQGTGNAAQTAAAAAPATSKPATNQLVPAKPATNQLVSAQPKLGDLFAPAAKALAQPQSQGFGLDFGDFFKDLITDLTAHARHRDPGRTNLAQQFADWFNGPIDTSSNDDDPFAKASNIEGVHHTDFDLDKNGRPVGLHGNRAEVLDEAVIYRENPQTGEFVPFAWNPYPEVKPNKDGKFVFNEARFPPFQPERGPDGKIIIRDGLQVWKPNNLSVGSTTAFEAMNSTSRASESWAGRQIDWGNNGKLQANAHSFIDFNAFYAPGAKQLFFGVVPYRLPGETQVKMFETATSWEMVAHESGHAIHHAMMPNADVSDLGWRTWSESFSDQTAMWGSLKDRGRAEALLKEIDGDLNTSNSLTRMGEAFAALVGEGTGMRDALHDKTVSTTSEEVHDRSEVLTGASYKIFQAVYQDQLANGRSRLDALQVAGDVMGTFNLRATEHIGQNQVSLEDVGQAWLKVDKEYFKGKFQNVIVDELKRREVFDDTSLPEFNQHEAGLPKLSMGFHKNTDALNSLIGKNLDKLGIGPGYSLKVLSHELDDNGAQIVHVQLMQGKGKDAIPLDNHGVMTFRPNGQLRDWHSPVPEGATTADVTRVLNEAKAAGLDTHGAPVAVKRGADGQLTAEARVMSGAGINAHVKAWTLDNPEGEVREVIDRHDQQDAAHLLPKGAHVLTAEELEHLTPADFAPPAVPRPEPVITNASSPFTAPPAAPAPDEVTRHPAK